MTVIEDAHQRSVQHVEFDSSGRYLVSVGGDDDNTLALYDCADTKRPVLVTSVGSSKAKVVAARFHPSDSAQLVTFGVKHIKFWALDKADNSTTRKSSTWTLKSKTGVFGKFETQTVLAAEWSAQSSLLYAAGYNGHILVFDKNTQVASVKAHDGPVFCLLRTELGLISAGKDGRVILWKEDGQSLTKSSVITELASAADGSLRAFAGEFPRALDYDPDTRNFLIGTSENRIWHLTESGQLQLLNAGHAGELWGLASHPTLNEAATVSVDGKLAVWNLTEQLPRLQIALGAANSLDAETGTLFCYSAVIG